jgi:hypothetical protein
MSWTATISSNGNLVGTAIINRIRTLTWNGTEWVQTSDQVTYRVRTRAYPCATSPCAPGEVGPVNKASLIGPGAGTPWEIVLCGSGTCTYQSDGNLDNEGTLLTLPPGFYLNLPQDFGVMGTSEVLLNDGTLGRATFERFM